MNKTKYHLSDNARFAYEVRLALSLSVALLLVSSCHVLYEFIYGFGGHAVLTAVGDGFSWNGVLARAIVGYVLAQLVLHATFGFAVATLAAAYRTAWPNSTLNGRERVGLSFLLLCTWAVIANALLFPNSALGSAISPVIPARLLVMSTLLGCSLVVGSLVLLVVIAAGLRSVRARWLASAFAAGTLLYLGAQWISIVTTRPASATENSRPHVILIGIDSFRSDFLDDPRTAELVPAIADFARESVVFTDAITPLARTFPSWTSILTGRHPHTTGAVVNLIPERYISLGATLPELLREQGYRTVYAIDESRFSNVDESYGFDRAVYPPMGAADFLLGEINDLPLSNLVINTRVGARLFPNAYANRGVAHAYDPDTFIEALDRELTFEHPTFFAVHFTLVHWPYHWSDSTTLGDKPTSRQKYDYAVKRVGQQVDSLLKQLERKGALENAIVVLLSDHGEGLGKDSHVLVAPGTPVDGLAIPVALEGHGTSVLAPAQYRTLLSFRRFGGSPFSAARIDVPASLEDIAPTVMEMLALDVSEEFDGVSLASYLSADSVKANAALNDRIRFTESESSKAPVVPIAGKLISEEIVKTATWYRVDPATGRIYLRDERVAAIVHEREYAALQGQMLLAAIPTFGEPEFRFVMLEGHDAPPRAVVADRLTSEPPRVQTLWAALHQRFPALRSAQQRHVTQHVTK